MSIPDRIPYKSPSGPPVKLMPNTSYRGRKLKGKYLIGDISGSDFTGADLRNSTLGNCFGAATFDGADIRGLDFIPENIANSTFYESWIYPWIPQVEDLEKRIYKIISKDKTRLSMGNWHDCNTVHCLGGWAIFLAGEDGVHLQIKFDPETAASMIYIASEGFIPDFFSSSEKALKDLRTRVLGK